MNANLTRVQWQGRSDRIHRIKTLLKQEKYGRPKQVADRLGICARTFQRDMQYMRDVMRFPVAYDPSEKGWFLTDASFDVPLAFVAKHDLQTIMVLGQLISQYEETPLGASMQSAFEGLMKVLFPGNEEDAEKVRLFAKRMAFVSAPAAKMNTTIWNAIVKALQTDQRLEIEYRKGGSGEPTCRKFDPYGLIVRNRDWFLHGYCHTRKIALTLFVPYMLRATLLDDYFELPRNFDLSAYARGGYMGMQSHGEPKQRVVLRFIPDVAAAAESAPFTSDQKMQREPSGHLIVSFETNVLFQVRRELMRWDAAVEVLEPAELRGEIRDAAKEVLNLYRRKSKATRPARR